jgi:hypothetical protein
MSARLAVALMLAACVACDLAVTTGAPDAREALRFQITEQEDTSVARVLGLVDRARLEVSGGGIAIDTVVPAHVAGGTVVARVVLTVPPGSGVLTVRAELRRGSQTLLVGSGTLQRDADAPILIRPMPGSLSNDPVPSQLDALGDVLRLSARVHFLTGDVWHGAEPTWESDNPGVLEVRPEEGIAIPRANGRARLRLSFEHLSRELEIRVAQQPTALWGVAPSDTTLVVGEAFPLRVFGADRNGFPLLPGARVSWVAGGGIVVDTLGVVTATQAGAAFARAVLGASQHTSTITVVDAPTGS